MKAVEKNTLDWNVLESIDLVSNASKGDALKIPKDQKVRGVLNKLKTYFGVKDSTHVLILCAYVSMKFSETHSSIYEFFGMTALSFFKYNKDLDELYLKGLLEMRITKQNFAYTISKTCMESMVSNIKISNEEEVFVPIDFVNKICRIAGSSGIILPSMRKEKCLLFEKKHEHNTMISTLKDILKDDMERLFFYEVCVDFLKNSFSLLVASIYKFWGDSYMDISKKFYNEESPLFIQGLLKLENKGNLKRTEVSITQKGQALLLGEYFSLYEQESFEKTGELIVIKNKSINAKELFYNTEEQKQIDLIKEILGQGNLNKVQKQFSEKGLPKGLAILFFGPPGTGKTESVYQIAKQTNRDIMHLDISASKTCWYGESEKLIKKIFTDYKEVCKKLIKSGKKNIPILLFNEADALFGKRFENPRISAESTENSIQNIILEELEKFEGILIATTNLTNNLDKAFERRFLFKAHLGTPSVEVKKAIWKDKIDFISDEEAFYLAESYNFSGGEIDNISRKATIEKIVKKDVITIDNLDDYCKDEKLHGQRGKAIGFR